jgi:hypothetical protein
MLKDKTEKISITQKKIKKTIIKRMMVKIKIKNKLQDKPKFSIKGLN